MKLACRSRPLGKVFPAQREVGRRHAAAVLGSAAVEGTAAVVVLLQCSRLQPRYK